MDESPETDISFREPESAWLSNDGTGTLPTGGGPAGGSTSFGRSDADAELLVRAKQVTRLTFRQYETIRDLGVAAGMAPEVAATTALSVADPQDAITQLKRPRQEVIAPEVTGSVLDLDVLTAGLIRAPENLRMGGRRYEGDFTMPKYGATPDNTALLFTLGAFEDTAEAMNYYFAELAKTDHEVHETNSYGDDIRRRGIRQGGILFPLKLKFSATAPGLAGWETADCYGRVYFTQEAEGIDAAEVLEWLRNVPTDGRELANHPLQKRRNALLAIAGKVLAGGVVTEAEELRLRRAVMPRTRMIVSVSVPTPLDEVRRRVVSLQHLDRPTPFSAVTDWQTRAEAVLAWCGEKDLFVHPPEVPSSTVRRWLDAPAEAVAKGECHGDDIAMIAIASLLHSPDTKLDRQIGKALRTRGVTGVQRTNARSEVAAHVICRTPQSGGSRDGVRSSMERVLRWTALRDQAVDMRPVGVLLEQATAELQQEAEARSLGRKPVPGPATRQIAARAAFHLVCSPANTEPLLRRSSHGAEKGQGIEPGQVLQKLASTLPGLQQLVQAIFDGRRGLPIRRVGVDSAAEDRADAPRQDEMLDGDALRTLALENKPMIADLTAAKRVADDSDELSLLAGQISAVVEAMGKRTDDEFAALPYVDERGWADPKSTIPVLKDALQNLEYWRQLYLVVNRQRRTDAPVPGEEHTR